MYTIDIPDPHFREAVAAIDSGNIPVLEQLLEKHPELVHKPLETADEGYFRNPYLVWFVANNPIRNDILPANITEVTGTIIRFMKREGVKNFQHQVDYTLGLVATGSISRECGVQIELIDLLLDAGASAGSIEPVLAHYNIAAAEHLLKKGSKLTLTAAVCLDRREDIERMAPAATPADLQVALVAAAFYGNAKTISYLLLLGADPGGYIEKGSGFHSHATPLHQAVSSGSLESVKILAEAGARLDLKDRVYGGTPIEWAEHIKRENGQNAVAAKKYETIEHYLRNKAPGKT